MANVNDGGVRFGFKVHGERVFETGFKAGMVVPFTLNFVTREAAQKYEQFATAGSMREMFTNARYHVRNLWCEELPSVESVLAKSYPLMTDAQRDLHALYVAGETRRFTIVPNEARRCFVVVDEQEWLDQQEVAQ